MKHTFRTLIVSLVLALFSAEASATVIDNLMPRPQEVKELDGTFTGRIVDAVVTVEPTAITTFDYKVAGFDNEGYTLSVQPDEVHKLVPALQLGLQVGDGPEL